RTVPRKTIVEHVSFDDMNRSLRNAAAAFKQLITSVPAPSVGRLPISSEHFHSRITKSTVYHFFHDLDVHYLAVGNMILEKIYPSRVVVVTGDRSSRHISNLCRQKKFVTSVERQPTFFVFLSRLFSRGRR